MMKTLLVTGGKDSQENLLSSTEINVDPAWHASVWSFAAPLPSARYDFPAASLDNSVFVFGQFYFPLLDKVLPKLLTMICLSWW